MKKLILRSKISILILAILISAAGFYSCNKDTPVTPTQTDNLSFSGRGLMDSIGDSQNQFFRLDTVKILIKDIKLKVANNNPDTTNFKVGPFVIFLNLDSSINTISSAIIPEGTYSKIKFEIHKLNNNDISPDPEFTEGYSVIVKGWYDGNYFVYKSKKSAHQILKFTNDIPITTANYTNITLIVKPYIWFIKDGIYLDPRIETNSNDIDNNIKDDINHNYKVFRDNNKDGFPD
ncbi:MAG: hypothetical protein NTU73_01650 [Ignavibacteriae bacterium]|nr:hypothetical protein [Ignavibacteriota bacterium]